MEEKSLRHWSRVSIRISACFMLNCEVMPLRSFANS